VNTAKQNKGVNKYFVGKVMIDWHSKGTRNAQMKYMMK
jgi:hypothetical protein